MTDATLPHNIPPMPHDAQGQEEADDSVVVRPATSADRPHVDRLCHAGLLPGRVDYESDEADRIRATLGSERDRFLVAEADGKIVGTIAVVEAAPDIGHLHWLRVDPEWQADLKVARCLARAAAAHARDVGLLKLAVHAPPNVEERVA
ncbi:MAG: Acetyltransferase domain, partial [Humisphaera sp.]|nr:Acetyltransferase domain [Humisphaera sp.]